MSERVSFALMWFAAGFICGLLTAWAAVSL